MAKEKDRSQRLHERHQIILADMLRLEENKYCADCNAKGPRWASWNLGVFICIRCAGIHRNLGVHISRVKSVNLDSWTQEQIESIQFKGNGKGREMYECHLPPGFKRPQDDYAVETFIRSKYVRKLYISKNTNDTVKPTSVSAKQETSPVQTSPSKNSSKSKKSSQAITVTPKPRTKPVKPVPSPSKPSPSSITSPTLDLLTDQPMINDQTKPLDQPLMGDLNPPTRVVKDSIMSLYDVQPGYNAQGYPVGSMYQQQMNAMHYQQQQWQKQQYQQWQQQQVKSQVDEVQRQMSRLRVGQQQHDSTLNPHLW